MTDYDVTIYTTSDQIIKFKTAEALAAELIDVVSDESGSGESYDGDMGGDDWNFAFPTGSIAFVTATKVPDPVNLLDLQDWANRLYGRSFGPSTFKHLY